MQGVAYAGVVMTAIGELVLIARLRRIVAAKEVEAARLRESAREFVDQIDQLPVDLGDPEHFLAYYARRRLLRLANMNGGR